MMIEQESNTGLSLVAYHDAQTNHFMDVAQQNKDLRVGGQTWTTTAASGSLVNVFFYSQVDCKLTFANGVFLEFKGSGPTLGLGGAECPGGGTATMNVEPSTLKGKTVSYNVAGISIGGGGFAIEWYEGSRFLGNGSFPVLGFNASFNLPGTGTFS